MQQDNFYILLEISADPPEHNSQAIETAIKNKQGEWGKQRNHPTKGREAQRLLGLISDMRQKLSDPDFRQEEARRAKTIIAQKEKEKFQRIDNAIKLISTKGYITNQEIKNLSKKFVINESEIRKRIKSCPIKNDKKENTTSQKIKPLDKTIEKRIVSALQLVGKKNLYDFLELSSKSSVKTLISRAQEKEKEIRKIAKKDAVVTESEVLAGLCLTVFKTLDSKNSYDLTRKQLSLTDLDNDLDIAGMDNIIQAEEFDALVKKGVSIGLSKDEAIDYIQKYSKKKKWFLEISKHLSVDEMKQCGICGLLNQASHFNCNGCGTPLELECPGCNTKNSNNSTACSNCGFYIGDMPNALGLIKKGKMALAGKNYEKAEALFREAEVYWPGNIEIVSANKQIKNYFNKINQYIQQLHNAIKEKNYYQAKQLISEIRKLNNKHSELSKEAIINKKISSAEAWIKKALGFKNEKDIIQSYQSALAESKDCQSAIDGMNKLPPAPPTVLKTSTRNIQTISVSWRKSQSIGDLAYCVIRKKNTPPESIKDGEILVKTTQTLFEDNKAEAGQIYYYAVYTLRGETPSKSSALSQTVQRIAEVKDLNAKPSTGCINLSWKKPSNALDIEVWRKENGIPVNSSDGKRLEGVRHDGVLDSGLKNGTSYGYRIITIYKGISKAIEKSDGITISSTPSSPPPFIDTLKSKKVKNKLNLSWKPPSRGNVILYISSKSFSFSKGDIINPYELVDLGEQVQPSTPNNAIYKIKFQGVIYVLPITIEGELYVAGESIAVTSIDEVSQIRHEASGGKIFLEWEWPHNCNKTLVSYRHDRYPKGFDDQVATKKYFTKVEYARESGFVISKPEAKDYYFNIFVVSDKTEDSFFSSGIHYYLPGNDAINIAYEIKITKSIFGKIKNVQLILSCSQPVQLSNLYLIKKRGNIPLNVDDGTNISIINTHIEKQAIIEIDISEIQANTYARVFFKDSDQMKKYRMVMPPKKKLKLF